MNHLAVANQKTFSLMPETLEQAMQYAKLISDSDFAPKEYRGKAGNVLIAVQYGAELGLSPMQAIQNISIINGRPCVWGDALLGLVRAHHSFLDIHEEIKNGVATCTVRRKNQEPVTRKFSIEDAKKAGLLGKAGTWTQYQERMLQMRARGFALRDAYADVLKGIITREEAQDYQRKEEYKKPNFVDVKVYEEKKIEVLEGEKVEVSQDELEVDLEIIRASKDKEEVQKTYEEVYKKWIKKNDKDVIAQIVKEANKRKSELVKMVKEFNNEINQNEDIPQ